MNEYEYELDNGEDITESETLVDDYTNDYLQAINDNLVIGIIIITFLLSAVVGILSVNLYKTLWKR